jgi:hypothetical protein
MTDSVKWAVRALRKRAREPSAGADATEELDIEVRVSFEHPSVEQDRVKLRKVQGKLKIEHSIIDGLRDVLEMILATEDRIRSIIPGVIRPVRDAKGKVELRVTVPVVNGWKAIALAAGARQELFISTDLDKPALEKLIDRVLRET